MATMNAPNWKPTWWKDEKHGTAWERVREAMHRDWEQTKKDMHVGGHELNQGMTDTVKQMTGKESLPPDDRANPAKVIGDISEWGEIEGATQYGFGARREYGDSQASWNDDVEAKLRDEWDHSTMAKSRPWVVVRGAVRRGYEFTPRDSQV